jgi:hypothetical protein
MHSAKKKSEYGINLGYIPMVCEVTDNLHRMVHLKGKIRRVGAYSDETDRRN